MTGQPGLGFRALSFAGLTAAQVMTEGASRTFTLLAILLAVIILGSYAY